MDIRREVLGRKFSAKDRSTPLLALLKDDQKRHSIHHELCHLLEIQEDIFEAGWRSRDYVCEELTYHTYTHNETNSVPGLSGDVFVVLGDVPWVEQEGTRTL